VTGVRSQEVPVEPSIGPTLRERIRSETADWHDRVEAITAAPSAIKSHDDYVELLGRFYELHASFEAGLAAPSLREAWGRLGIDLSAHRRAHLCSADLKSLDALPTSNSMATPDFRTSGHALGCLYVLEGSSLGGPIFARIVRARLGNVPTAFLSGHGRAKRTPWSSVVNALSRFEAQGGDCDVVVDGACETFATFATVLGRKKQTRHEMTASA